MAPKPFPFPIGIGIDLCRVNRIASILRHEHTLDRWARRIFTRLEWPALCRRMQCVEKSLGEPLGRKADVGSDGALGDEFQAVTHHCESASWMLPKLSGCSSTLEVDEVYWSAIADERSTLGALARHLAGRWAAKEAAIKAHRHRQLYMQDISIVRPIIPPGSIFRTGTGGARKLIALIDPPSDRIEMVRSVASSRELRGFGRQNRGLHKGALMSKDELHKEEQDEKDEKDGQVPREAHYYRRSRVKDSDRQVAEINISHDGDYAVATCMAFDPPVETTPERTIVDNGKGLPLHEPQWGDEGWLDSRQTRT